MNEENTTIMPPEKQIVQDDRDARAEELENAFSYDGYQVVRKELFAHNHYPGLDVVRVIAIAGIVLMHVLANGNYDLSGFLFEKVIGTAGNFTILFMMVSAFGMCCGYYEKFKAGTINIEAFYKRRYEKLWPFFALLCILDGIFNAGVSIFVLISGYFGIRRSTQKLIELESTVILYAVLSALVGCYFGKASILSIIKAFIPVSTNCYWFISCYILLMIFSPYINRAIDSMSELQHKADLFADL